jgi:hypothetical protein
MLRTTSSPDGARAGSDSVEWVKPVTVTASQEMTRNRSLEG